MEGETCGLPDTDELSWSLRLDGSDRHQSPVIAEERQVLQPFLTAPQSSTYQAFAWEEEFGHSQTQ